MKKVQKMFRKAVSMIVAVCLMVGIANIPVYAGISATVPVKTTNAVLGKTYYTPAKAVKKATATKKPTAKKTTAKKATATKKPAAKAVSLTSKIIKKYTKKGLTTLKAFANKMGIKLQTVYNQFVKYGVTKAQMTKVASGLLKMVKRGADFCVCSTLAVSRYLGISQALTAVQQIAAEISLNYFDADDKDHYIATTWTAQAKVLSKNGVKNSTGYEIKLADLLSMKKGTKILVNADCYTKQGYKNGCHAITITREKNGKYGVYDVLVNGGNKIVYTKAQIKRLLNGQSAKGKTESGVTITKSKYLASAEGYLSYKFVRDGSIYVVGNSSKIVGSDTKNKYNQTTSVINKLLKNKNLNSLVKSWLKKAKTALTKVLNSSKSDDAKYSAMFFANYLLDDIKKANGSLLSVIKATTSNVSSVFSSLKSILKNNFTYKVYNKYGQGGLNVITELAKRYNLSQKVVYNQFVNNKVTKSQMEKVSADLLMYTKNGWEVLDSAFGEGYIEVENALASIKQLLKK